MGEGTTSDLWGRGVGAKSEPDGENASARGLGRKGDNAHDRSFLVIGSDCLQENMVLGLVGETIDVGDEVCGARVVDKSKGGHAIYRFELWLRNNDPSTANR